MSAPPTYEKATFNFQNRQSINKQIFQTIIEKLNEIENIEENGIDDLHSSFIRQIVKAFDKIIYMMDLIKITQLLYPNFLQELPKITISHSGT